MNKNHRGQTHLSPEKIDSRKRKMVFLLLSLYLLSTITEKNKQTIYPFNDIQASGLYILQYYNIHKTMIIMMIII